MNITNAKIGSGESKVLYLVAQELNITIETRDFLVYKVLIPKLYLPLH